MGGSSPLLLVDMHNNNFYSLAENKVVSLGSGDDGCGGDPTAAAVIIGSSRGWLALMTQDSLDLFLWNPISQRRVDLPSIHNLSIAANNLEGGFGCVAKLIMSSSSPGDADCRVVLCYYGPVERLAFCCPGHSAEWITIGAKYLPDGSPRVYTAFAFSTRRRNHLFCIIGSIQSNWELECWDLEEPFSPRIYEPDSADEDDPELEDNDDEPTLKLEDEDEPELEDDDEEPALELEDDEPELKNEGDDDDDDDDDDGDEGDDESEDEGEDNGEPFVYLVVADQDHWNEEQLFIVVGNLHLGKLLFSDWKNMINHPNKTLDFDVYKIGSGGGGEDVRYEYLESLDGLSIFVGINECFALSAAEFPELKPDSIYFTDPVDHRPNTFSWWNSCYGLGRYDIGIFDYIKKVFYPCYSPPKRKEDEELEPKPEEDGNPEEEVSPTEVGGEGLESEEDDDEEELPLIVWFTPCP